jgi:RNA polymerase sigma-70 factor (ECF subfamily)
VSPTAAASLEQKIEHPPEFEPFFEAEHRRLLRALYLITGNAEEAEDLMQEAFLKVWEGWDRVRRMDDPTGYLYRTAMNTFRSGMRRALRVARHPFAAQQSDDFVRVEERDEAARALGRMTKRQRTAVVLTEYLGYATDEAAALLDVKPVTIRVLASQGRAAIRRALGESGE